jgi:tetratricopeptide (TPR) repeat protein
LLGSSAALSDGKNAIPWVARALERSPNSAEAHVQLGRILQARGALSQALGALRRAIELDPQQLRAVLRLGARWGLPPEMMATAAPAGPAGAPLLLLLARQTKSGPERLRLLELAIEHDPAQADAHHQLGSELLREVSKSTPAGPCAADRDACLARAREHASHGALRGSSRTSILEARILAEAGQGREAEALLARTCEELASDPSCADALMQQALANDSPRLTDAVTRLVAMACGSRESCGEAHLRIGHRFAGARRWNVAFTHYRQAVEEAPSREAWQALARAARQLGEETLAADAERRGGLSGGGKAAEPATPAIEKTEPSVHPEPPGGEPFERGASD